MLVWSMLDMKVLLMGALMEVENPNGAVLCEGAKSRTNCVRRDKGRRSKVIAVFTNLQRIVLDAMGQGEYNIRRMLDPRFK